MPVTRIVCLANSRKHSGHCIAGKELSGTDVGGWIRPVSDRQYGELLGSEVQCRGGGEPKILEVMDLPLLAPKPHLHQRENWLIEPGKRFEKAGGYDQSRLGVLVDPVGPLWVNKYSTAVGCNDEVPIALAERLESSLRLIQVDKLVLHVFDNYGKRKVLGAFRHDGTAYRLSVTDPCFADNYGAGPDGRFELGPSALCISLGEPYAPTKCCHKLIAGIILLESGVTP